MPVTTDEIMQYETGEMRADLIPNFFQRLIDSGMVWSLQGHYGRVATALIASGTCHKWVRP